MEADILIHVERFCMSEITHRRHYMEVIVEWGQTCIGSRTLPSYLGSTCENLEHACKNYRAKLESIIQDNPRYKERGGLTQKLTAAARTAIRIHSSMTDAEQLRHDLQNAPFHVFGDYTQIAPIHFAELGPTVSMMLKRQTLKQQLVSQTQMREQDA